MKSIKKMSLLIVLAILVTVGGVYAQWVYEDNNYVGGESNNVDISMQAYINTGNQQGFFEAKYINLQVSLADNYNGDTLVPAETAGDYYADIAGHGSMLFLFKAYSQTTNANMEGLTFNIEFREQSPILYNGTPIFQYRNATGKTLTALTADNVGDLCARYANLDPATLTADLTTAEKPGLYYLELTFDHLFVEDIDTATDGVQTHIALSDAFKQIKIDNLEKWDALNDAILSGAVTVYITDSRQPANP